MGHAGQVALKKPSVLLALGQFGGTTPVFDATYQAVINYAITQGFALPSIPNRIKQNALVVALKAAAIWSEFALFYNFVTSGDHNFAKINWVSPGTFQAIGTAHDLTFVPMDGFNNTLGGNNYFDTQFIPSSNGGGKHKVGDASLIVDFVGTNTTVGARTSSFTNQSFVYNAGLNFYACVNAPSATFTNALNYTFGFIHARRSSTATTIYKEGVFLGNASVNTPVLPTLSLYINAFNFSGVVNSVGTGKYRLFALGSALATKEAALYNAWNSYLS